MALPQTVRVKLSSEAAESISLTPVVVQETAGARAGGAHAGRHRQGRGAHSRAAAARHAGERRHRDSAGRAGRPTWRTCANCWPRFRIPTPRAGFAARRARAPFCAAGARRSRFRGKPGCAKGCSSARVFGIALMEVIGGGNRYTPGTLTGSARTVSCASSPATKLGKCAPRATA